MLTKKEENNIHYSVIRSSFVYQGWEEFEPQIETMSFQGKTYLSVEKINGREGKIMGLSSTDPADYLRKNLQPGTKIEI